MIDGYGRNIDYVRISVTERCNLRCVYCMPEEGVPLVSHDEILTFDEILALAKVFAGLGIRKIKLTGGEPLVRKGIVSLVRALKQIPQIEQVTITTNGVLLGEYMGQLADAGVDGINLSLDTLDPGLYEQITRKREAEKVMDGFQKALEYPQIPLKINCVPIRWNAMKVPEKDWADSIFQRISGQNLLEIADLARKYKVHVRFIEMMPIGPGAQFQPATEDELLLELKARYGEYQVCGEKLGNGPGHYYTFPGFQGKIGFISAISHKFCDQCNRIRLTSQGFLKTCLQYDVGVDLRVLLRSGADETQLSQAICDGISRKPIGHCFGENLSSHGEKHMMAQIGG